jgi:hypothetical protein
MREDGDLHVAGQHERQPHLKEDPEGKIPYGSHSQREDGYHHVDVPTSEVKHVRGQGARGGSADHDRRHRGRRIGEKVGEVPSGCPNGGRRGRSA